MKQRHQPKSKAFRSVEPRSIAVVKIEHHRELLKKKRVYSSEDMPTMSNKLWWFLVALVYMRLLENSLLEARPQNPTDNSRIWREEYQHIDGPNYNALRRPNFNASSLLNKYLDGVVSRQQRRQRASSQLSGGATEASLENDAKFTFFGKQRNGKIGFDLGERKQLVPPPPPPYSIQNVTKANANADVATTSNNTNAALVPFKPISPMFYQEGMEVFVSVDPSSLIRLVVVSAQASASFANAFFGTLRLVAPMIVARRFLSTVGFLFYDHYTGRYIRTTYNRRLKHARLLDLPAAVRGLGRTVLELTCMAAVGKLVEVMLTTAPCWMRTSICHWWFGMMWMLSVLAASRVVEVVMAKYPPLQIETVNNAKFDNPRRVFTRPWHVLQQWLRDPEEWISNMAAYNERIVNRDRPFQPDPLLFPSTWPPLRILIYIAVVRVMTTTLWDPNQWGGYGIMREFLLQHVLYDEWYRILMKEKRVALAAVMNVFCFLSTLCLFYTAMLADGLAPVLILPPLLASMFSGWMNIVLYWERLVERQEGRGRRRRDSRGGVLLAGTRTRKVAENKKRLNMEWLY